MFLIFTLFKAFIDLFTISMTIGPALNAGMIDKSAPDNAGDNSGKDGKEVEMKDPTTNETQSKSSEDPPIANQDLEVKLSVWDNGPTQVAEACLKMAGF